MSTAPEKDPVKEVRERIIQLAREIEEFSKSNIPPKTFFTEFLKRVIAAVGARAGAVWMRNANRIELLVEQGLDKTGFNNNPNALSSNQKLLGEVLSNGQACTYQPGETSEQLPTEDMLVLAALLQNKDVVGVVEIFQRADTPKAARPGFLQFVEQMTGYACRFLERQATAQHDHGVTVGKVAEEFEQFVLQLHKSLDPREVAFTAANDGRLLVGCDRMSVAVLDGKKAVIRAISGQESVNQRANLVRKMTDLAQDIISTGETLTYTGKIDQLAPKTEKVLGDFIQESGSRMVIVIPVLEPEELIKKDDDSPRPKVKARKAVGGIIIEQVSESQPKPGVVDKADLLADHVGSAIYNAKRYHRIFLMPVWVKLGKAWTLLEGKNGMKATLGVLAFFLVLAALWLVQWEYRVEGEGRMMPVVQKDIFAPWDGDVVDIKVDSGQRVKQGDLLLVIDNKELNQQYVAAGTDLAAKEAVRAGLEAQLKRTIEQTERDKLNGQLLQTDAEAFGLQKQREVLEERLKSLQVTAPIGGIVSTFQIRQLLQNRPVKRGEVLLEIKDDSQDWRLELDVQDHRMGHIIDAQKALKTEALKVEYVLATDSETTFKGTLGEMATRTNPSEEKGAVVVFFAPIDVKVLPRGPRIGAEVRAKIHCGKKALGYVLFGDVIEFVYKYLWLPGSD